MTFDESACGVGSELLARWDLAAFGAKVSASHVFAGRPADAIIGGENLGSWWGVPPAALRDGVTVTVTLPSERPVKLFALHWAQWPIPIEFAITQGEKDGNYLVQWRTPASQRELVPVPDAALTQYTIHIRQRIGPSPTNGSLLVQVACLGRLASGPKFRSAPAPNEWFGLSSHMGYADNSWWDGAAEVRLARSLGMKWVRITARWDIL